MCQYLIRKIGLFLVATFWVCPTFYTWRFYRVVRLTRPTVLREPYGAKSNLPSACSPPLGGGTLVLCLAGMSGRLSLIVPCRYPLRHVSHGKPTVVKGGRGRLPCRGSLHRLSPRYTRTPLWARPLRMERRLSSLICASTTFNRSWGRRRRSIGARNPPMSMCMNCRRSTIR